MAAEAPIESQYGSPEADAAVQKLQSMGATVYPPGNKDAIDWGALAGMVQQGARHSTLCSCQASVAGK